VVIEAIEGFFHRQTSFIESIQAWISEGIRPNQSSKKSTWYSQIYWDCVNPTSVYLSLQKIP
jgi:hypothetical protein